MPIFVNFSSVGGKRFFKTGNSPVHGVSKGQKKLKPSGLACLPFDYSVQAPRGISTGLASGRRQHGAFTITKEKDSASPLLYSMACTNEVLSQLKINFESVGSKGSKQSFASINLTNATIVGIKRNPNSGRTGMQKTYEWEDISFAFTKITFVGKKSKSDADDWETGP